MKLSTYLALLGVAQSQTITYDANLKCGQCIKGSFVFCVKGDAGAVVASGGTEPQKKCCQDATCAEVSDATWKCSNTYSSKEFAVTMCPQRQAKCGAKQTVALSQEG